MTNRLFADLRAGRPDVPRVAVTTPLCEIVEALNAYRPDAADHLSLVHPSPRGGATGGRLRIAPRQFSSAAETLTQDVRDLARETWGAAVLNAYGATEANLIGMECPYATGLHVIEDLLVLEVVDENYRPVPSGVVGHKVLVTTLFNRTLPFIRYEFSGPRHRRRRALSMWTAALRLASLQGRREDVISLPARNGGRVSVHALQLQAPLHRMPEVRQFQLSPRPAGLAGPGGAAGNDRGGRGPAGGAAGHPGGARSGRRGHSEPEIEAWTTSDAREPARRRSWWPHEAAAIQPAPGARELEDLIDRLAGPGRHHGPIRGNAVEAVAVGSQRQRRWDGAVMKEGAT